MHACAAAEVAVGWLIAAALFHQGFKCWTNQSRWAALCTLKSSPVYASKWPPGRIRSFFGFKIDVLSHDAPPFACFVIKLKQDPFPMTEMEIMTRCEHLI